MRKYPDLFGSTARSWISSFPRIEAESGRSFMRVALDIEVPTGVSISRTYSKLYGVKQTDSAPFPPSY